MCIGADVLLQFMHSMYEGKDEAEKKVDELKDQKSVAASSG